MAHKDWDGEGNYHCYLDGKWDHSQEIISCSGILSSWRYKKFEPPNPPKKELPDGVYLVEQQDGAPTTWIRVQGCWHFIDGSSS